MRILTSTKYQFSRARKSLIIFYGILIGVSIAISILNNAFSPGEAGSSNSIEMSSVIFIFVTGLNSFKSEFNFALANGVSRKTLFISSLLNLFSIATLMTFIDLIIGMIFSKISEYNSLFIGIYSGRYGTLKYTAENVLEGILWSVVIYTVVAVIGYLITTLYYRLNKGLKLTISIGVPVFVTIGIPYLDVVTKGKVSYNIYLFFAKALGIYNGASNPYMAVLSGLCAIAIIGGFTYLLIRRATIKE
ncbi:MAG: hypothetical protein K0R15_243 [Clostridiales bacterium]|jgi:hypothetical protein|nr:hypothetical protein [Clostridiales bacterium]